MENNERVVEIVKAKGPLIPVQIAKELETSILFASAMLSELVSKGIIKISSVKIGGSPLYYFKGQEEKLQNFVDNLHEKEKKAYDLIKEKQILKDSEQEPVIRVALRGIKDFARPFEVKRGEESEIFWKWYLLSDDDAAGLIRQKLGKRKITKEKKKIIKKREIKPDMFLDNVVAYFNKNNIEVVEKNVVKKGKDIEFIVRLPSAVGKLEYFCKVRNKKRVGDSDLASAIITGQAKKLPVLFLMNGELTKKAKEKIGELKGIQIARL